MSTLLSRITVLCVLFSTIVLTGNAGQAAPLPKTLEQYIQSNAEGLGMEVDARSALGYDCQSIDKSFSMESDRINLLEPLYRGPLEEQKQSTISSWIADNLFEDKLNCPKASAHKTQIKIAFSDGTLESFVKNAKLEVKENKPSRYVLFTSQLCGIRRNYWMGKAKFDPYTGALNIPLGEPYFSIGEHWSKSMHCDRILSDDSVNICYFLHSTKSEAQPYNPYTGAYIGQEERNKARRDYLAYDCAVVLGKDGALTEVEDMKLQCATPSMPNALKGCTGPAFYKP
jgi:hypothetical protein